jgi:ATP-dependent Clp protease adapter protein ClpS
LATEACKKVANLVAKKQFVRRKQLGKPPNYNVAKVADKVTCNKLVVNLILEMPDFFEALVTGRGADISIVYS